MDLKTDGFGQPRISYRMALDGAQDSDAEIMISVMGLQPLTHDQYQRHFTKNIRDNLSRVKILFQTVTIARKRSDVKARAFRNINRHSNSKDLILFVIFRKISRRSKYFEQIDHNN